MRTNYQKKSWVTLAFLTILCVILLILLLLWPTAPAKAQSRPSFEESTLVKEGQQAPDFEVTMFDGSVVKLADLKGKVVLLNFWATWCPPCRAELARVQTDIIERFKGQDFLFLPISRGEKRATVEGFRNKEGYSFPMGLDTNESIYKKFAITYIPRNFLIDKEGRIVKVSIGYDPEEFNELIKLIENTIKK